MGSFSLTHWLVVLAIVLILFGAGRHTEGPWATLRAVCARSAPACATTAPARVEDDKLVNVQPADLTAGLRAHAGGSAHARPPIPAALGQSPRLRVAVLSLPALHAPNLHYGRATASGGSGGAGSARRRRRHAQPYGR